jgi:cytochrome c oxidase subunit 2
MLTIGAIASIVGVALTLWMDWFPEQAAGSADDIDTLYDVLLICSVPVFVLVMTVAIYSVWRFRAKPGDRGDGPPIHGNTRLEIIWVTIPFVMVTALAVYGGVVLADIEEKKPNELKVEVTGQQFTWSFEYPQQGGKNVKATELVLPRGRPVHFRIHAKDVIHSFWVPAFRLKSDAVPGITTTVRLTPSREGVYEVVCAELCGIGHSTMRQNVRVVPAGEFESWLAKRGRGGAAAGAEPGTEEAGAAGKQVFADAGCDACHTLADAGATAKVGPNLDELLADARKYGKGKSAEEYVKESIVDPAAFEVPGFPAGTMPKNYEEQLTEQEIGALVDYLLEAGRKTGGSKQ